MKRIYFLIALSTISLLSIVSYGQTTVAYCCGSLKYKDGHEEEFRYVKVPENKNQKTILVSNDGEDKNVKVVDAKDLESVTFWLDYHPEKRTTLCYIEADRCGVLPTSVWGEQTPIASSSWGTVYQCYVFITMEKYNGRMKGTSPLYYLVCKDFEQAQVLYSSVAFQEDGVLLNHAWVRTPKKTAKLFASKPEVANRIKNEELKPRDIQYILNEMAAE